VFLWFAAPSDEFDMFQPRVMKVLDTVARRVTATEELIHPSAKKGYSRKSVSSILYDDPPLRH